MTNPQTVARQALPYKQQWETLLHDEKRPNKHAALTREGDTTTITVSTEPKLTDAQTVTAYMSGLAHWARTTPTPRALITPPVAHVKNRRIFQPLALLLWQLNNPDIDIDTTNATYRDIDYVLWQGVTRELDTFRLVHHRQHRRRPLAPLHRLNGRLLPAPHWLHPRRRPQRPRHQRPA